MVKKKTIIIIVLFVLLYVGFIIFMRKVNSNEGAEYKGLLGKKRTYSVEIDYEMLVKENEDYILEMFRESQLAIDLEAFKQGKEYSFDKIIWNTSLEDVKGNAPYSLVEDSDRIPSITGYTYYISEDKHTLYDQYAVATYVFYDDQLKQVQLNFDSIEKEKRAKNVFDTAVKNLIEICGQETVKTEDDTVGQASYQWDAKNTILRVELVNTNVIITVGLKVMP